jgi:hypothetical protein
VHHIRRIDQKVAQCHQKDGSKLSAGAVTEDGAMQQKGANLSMTIKNMKSLDGSNDPRFCIGKKWQGGT